MKFVQFISFLILAILCTHQFSSNTTISQNALGCQYPLILQYLTSSTLPSNDLQTTITTKLKTPLTLKDLTNSHQSTTFKSIQFQPLYSGNHKSIQSISPTKIYVKNDSIVGKIVFVAEVAKTVGKNVYNVTIMMEEVFISYGKEFDIGKGGFVVGNFSVGYLEGWLGSVGIVPEPKDADKTKILTVINGDLATQLKLQINTIQLWMSDETSKSNIGTIYPQGTYTYQFYTFTETINMSSMGIQIHSTPSQATFINKLKAQISSTPNKQCPSTPKQTYQSNSSQFITWQFIRNMAYGENLGKYGAWQNIDVNRTWMRTVSMQWKLVDLEFVVPGIVERYASYYMSDVKFVCGYVVTRDLVMKEQEESIVATVDWTCNAYIYKPTEQSFQPIKFLKTNLTIDHTLKFRISHTDSLAVYSDSLELQSAQFYGADDGQQIQTDENRVRIALEETFNDFRTYVIGTYFKVKEGSSDVGFDGGEDGMGIWIS